MTPVAFRPLERADFARLSGWLAEPLVRRWWNHDPAPAAVARDFGPSVDGEDGAEYFVAAAGGVPFGLIQRYEIAAYPEYLAELAPIVAVPPGALSIDYLIGAPAYRGRGLGAAMIASFAAQAWVAYPDAPAIVVPVARGNTASWRALARAGFGHVASGPLAPDNPVDPPDHVVYALERPRISRA